MTAATCTTCGHPAAEPYSSETRGELCCDPIHVPFYDFEQRAHFDRFRAELGAGADYRRGSEIIAARVLGVTPGEYAPNLGASV